MGFLAKVLAPIEAVEASPNVEALATSLLSDAKSLYSK
jgi:hypothetical protein